MKDKLIYFIKIVKSVSQDLKSWEQIKLNRWSLHIPIGIIVGFLLGLGLSMTFVGIPLFIRFLIVSFISAVGLFGFELSQRMGRIIGAKEKFESEKDFFAGWISSLIGIIIAILL